MSARNLAAMSAADPGFEGAMTALAAELESLPPATLYLTLSKLSTKGLRLFLDENFSVVSDRLNEGDNAASKLKDLLRVKADPVGTAPASGHDASAPAADAWLCSLRLPPLLTLTLGLVLARALLLPVLLVRSQWTCLAAALPLTRGLSKAQSAKGAGANLRRRLCFCHLCGSSVLA